MNAAQDRPQAPQSPVPAGDALGPPDTHTGAQRLTAWVSCSNCRGYGLVDGMHGPRDCPYCRGDGVERARDQRGRFVSVPLADREARS